MTDEDQQYAQTMHSVARLLRADTEITILADRLWRVHPKEIQDLGITRQQYYEREIRAVFENLLFSQGENGWQDIETAPHETRVLLGWVYDGAWFCETGLASHGWRRNGISNMSRHGQATHWRPIPEGPEASQGRAEGSK